MATKAKTTIEDEEALLDLAAELVFDFVENEEVEDRKDVLEIWDKLWGVFSPNTPFDHRNENAIWLAQLVFETAMLLREPEIDQSFLKRYAKRFALKVVTLGLQREFSWPTFDLTQSVSAALSLTDTSNVASGNVKFPFPCFTLVLPGPEHLLRGVSPLGKPFHVLEIIVQDGNVTMLGAAQSEALFLPKLETIMVDPTLSSLGRIRKAVAEFSHAEVEKLPAKKVILIELHTDLDKDYRTMFYRTDRPNDAEPIESILARDEGSFSKQSLELQQLFKAALRIVVNFSLYLKARCPTSADGRFGGDAKRIQNQNRWVVGRAVKLPSQLIASARETAAGNQDPAWKLKQSHVVRGHWKGRTGRAGHADIFIEPYWRGPKDQAEAIQRTYDVATMTERNRTH